MRALTSLQRRHIICRRRGCGRLPPAGSPYGNL